MDVRALNYFVAIAELGSFSAAARHLNVAQPALSRHMKRLEEEVAATLLLRTVRGVILTEAGERLLRHALSILGQIALVPHVVGGPTHQLTGRVSIGLPTSAGAIISRPLLRTLAQNFPGLQVHLVESLSGDLHEGIQVGRLDVALLFDPVPAPNLELRDILVEELYLVGSPAMMENIGPEIAFSRLVQYRLVLPGVPHSLRRLLDSMARSNGVRLNLAVEIDSLSLTKSLIRDGGCLAILAAGAVWEEIDAGSLVAARIIDPVVSRSVALATSVLPGRTRACEAVGSVIVALARTLQRSGIWRSAVLLETKRGISHAG